MLAGTVSDEAAAEIWAAYEEGAPVALGDSAYWPECSFVHALGVQRALDEQEKSRAATLARRAHGVFGESWRGVVAAVEGEGTSLADLDPTTLPPALQAQRARSLPPSQQPDAWRAMAEAYLDERRWLRVALEGLRSSGHPSEADALAARAEVDVSDPVSEEVIVYSAEAARRLLEDRLVEMGYRAGRARDGRVRFLSTERIGPWVDVYADGRVELQQSGALSRNREGVTEIGRSGLSLGDGGFQANNLISKRKMRTHRLRVWEEIGPQVKAWREALYRER